MRRALCGSALLLLAACQGRILDPDLSDTIGGGGGGPDGGPGGEKPVCLPRAEPSLRRLRHTEYANTVQALFPGTVVPLPSLAIDPAAGGYDNNADALGPSPLLIDQYHDAAKNIAAAAVANLSSILSCNPVAFDPCSRTFVAEFGKKVFRRPLSQEELDDFHTPFELSAVAGDFSIGAQLTIQAMLESPQFLYRIELPSDTQVLDGYARASRLSYFLWGSMPDDALFGLAGSGALSDKATVRAQAERMLEDPRAKVSFRDFHAQWMHRERLDAIDKLPSENFSSVRPSIHEESDRFIDSVLFDRGGSIADLFTSRTTFVDATVAGLYGIPAPSSGWQEVTLDPRRAGFLTQTAFLAGHGHPNNPSPVLRGVFILDRVLCSQLGRPPQGAQSTPLPAENMGRPPTNREAYEIVTAGTPCSGCHTTINPIGFAFENFDTVGRYRDIDQGVPVDATGKLPDGTSFSNGVDLAGIFAQSETVKRCMTHQRLTFAYGGGPESLDPCIEDEVYAEFADRGFSLRELTLAIVAHPRFFGGEEPQ